VNDPVYGRNKHYEGFWLEDVVRFAGIEFSRETMLVFTCLDGYQARLMRDTVPSAKPLLAVRDLDIESGWEVFFHGKEKTTPAPFYLVWQTSSRAGEATNNSSASLPWPYQINRIDLRSAIEAQSRLLPAGAESRNDIQLGFDLFTKSCISCHSINLEGGTLGPELNIPKNITEYRDSSYLVDFIKDPSSFRAKSKMPAFKPGLTDQQIDDILQYLRWMRERKLPLE
jgi:mono/diheme cytochrome c family protein